MEYLDYYDEQGNFLGTLPRDVVHRDGLWHNTVHAWLYTYDGRAIFQIRKDSNKFYTSASGHVDAGETIKDALARETKEELGLNIDAENATLIDVVTWKMDKVKKDGTVVKDRAKAHVHLIPYIGDYKDFAFDENEVLGAVFVDAKDALELFSAKIDHISALIVKNENGQNITIETTVSLNDFLVMEGENQLEKYGSILTNIISLTDKVDCEYLDYYAEDGTYLGYAPRDIVHRYGLWHKTVQNWFYTEDGKCLFQIRKDSGKLYTSSSGHVDVGESLEEALIRETMEELGIQADPKKAKVIDLVTWKMDKVKSNGFALKDRAKSTFFLVPYEGNYKDFHFDENEVRGAVFVNAKETLELFEGKSNEIDAILIQEENGQNVRTDAKIHREDFLLLDNENLTSKYGVVLNSIIEETKKEYTCA